MGFVPLFLILFFLFAILSWYFLDYRGARRSSHASYDERQVQNRMKAYRLGFLAMLITGFVVFLVYLVWSTICALLDLERSFPIGVPVLLAFVLAVGVCCFFIYTMFTEAYVTEWRTSRRRFSMLLLHFGYSLGLFFVSLLYVRDVTEEVFSFLTILHTEYGVLLIFVLSYFAILIAFVIKQLKKPEPDIDQVLERPEESRIPDRYERTNENGLFGVFPDGHVNTTADPFEKRG